MLSFFFFNDTATTEIYTLSLHDALPIYEQGKIAFFIGRNLPERMKRSMRGFLHRPDRKSTRLNSSHDQISYAVFCLKKKKAVSTQQAFASKPPDRAAASIRTFELMTSTH